MGDFTLDTKAGLKKFHAAPAYIAENSFGDYITASLKILREVYRVIVAQNIESLRDGELSFDISALQTWRQILGLRSSRKDLVGALLGPESGQAVLRQLLQANRPANVSFSAANEAISELIKLFDLSRPELATRAAQVFSQDQDDITVQDVLYRAIIPVAMALHQILDLFDQPFSGFGITGLPPGSSVGAARVTLSTDAKLVFQKTKRFGLRIRFERVEFPTIELGGTNRRIAGLAFEKIIVRVLTTIGQPAPSGLARIFDHDVQEGQTLGLSVQVNLPERLMMPYDLSNIPRLGGNRDRIETLITGTMDRLLGNGLVTLAEVLETVLPNNLVRYFAPSSFNATALFSRVRPKASSKGSGPLRAFYSAPSAMWTSGRLRLESLQARPEGEFSRVPSVSQGLPPPRPFESVQDAQDDVFNMWSVRAPDWPKFSRDWKRPGRVRVASNTVGPTIFARHFIRDLQPVKRLKVRKNFAANIQGLDDIALDFQGEITPAKRFAQFPALSIRGLACSLDIDGAVSTALIDARIRLRPALLSHGALGNTVPALRQGLAQSYNSKSELSELIEHVHFRNFIFLHQSYLPSEVEILSSSNIPHILRKEDVEELCEAWARAIPAIPLMLDPWFLVHPRSNTLKSSSESLSQGEILPLIEGPDLLGLEETFRNLAIAEGILKLNGEYLLNTQPLDPTQNLLSAFTKVHVRNGWVVMERDQSIFDALI